MKSAVIFAAFAALLLSVACSSDDWHRDYDARLCDELAVKIDSRAPLSQEDYTAMIAQSEDILKYVIERSRTIGDMPDSVRQGAWRDLLADPEYLERFGYMFTLGTALYQANVDGALDKKNLARYAELDKYNADLAAVTDCN